MTPEFDEKLTAYIENVTRAHASQQSERQISHLFLGFIGDAFGMEYQDIELEQHITMTRVQKHGYIDALIGDLLVEFKRGIKTIPESSIHQLRDYMRDMPALHRYIGMLTDGIRFRTYVLDEAEEAKEVDRFDITKEDADVVYLWLDSYLFSRKDIEPTADDIVQRFGINSPTFQLINQTLNRLLGKIGNSSEIDVWRGQWRALLSKVYGSDIADDELFLRHTYLSQFAKLLVYTALQGRPNSKNIIPLIVNGEAFHQHGVSNIGENDFFSWVLMDAIRQEAIDLLYGLAVELQVYDLSIIRQDLLKQLYQNLVDPETRHDLGEYYTPDWLAQLTLQEIDYRAPQSLLDPACGSGTFLFNAIRRLADNGLTGRDLVEFALNNIMGTDVHPLAVTIARVNYLLALTEHFEGTSQSELLPLPVFMADALIRPLENRSEDAVTIPVDWDKNELFHIPLEAASDADKLTKTIQYMDEFANIVSEPHQMSEIVKLFRSVVQDVIYDGLTNPTFMNLWASNFQLLVELIHEGRNSIWAYILKNLSRPLVLAEKGFDAVAGNPPWLAYRYINSAVYQDEVKDLYVYYQLIQSGDVKLFTQMDLSTLFFAHARDRYLKDDGTLAFVMPRSVLTGAKQHRLFQRQGMTRILDVQDVKPLFNVPSAVLILSKNEVTAQNIPTKTYHAHFDKHELPLAEAETVLRVEEARTDFVDSGIRSLYHGRFVQGASLVPRNLCFVRPAGVPTSPSVKTDPELDRDAKPPWKGIELQGTVSDMYIYATLLSKHLLPFGFQKLNMVALPAKLDEEGELQMLQGVLAFAANANIRDFQTWFEKADKIWEQCKKSNMTLPERYDYHKLLSSQNVKDNFRVIYNSNGTNLASCVLEIDTNNLRVYGRRVQGFVADTKTYYYSALTLTEAHYLCAILNAPCVNDAIKKYQAQGLFGPRDIHRTPFEACAIPLFKGDDPDHQELAGLSMTAHGKIEDNKAMEENKLLNGGPSRSRRIAREIAADEIKAIDEIARRILAE